MAQLGVTRLVDLIGRTDLLKELDGFTAKQQKLALSKLLETAEPHPGKALYCTERPPVGSAFRSHEASIIGNTCLYGATSAGAITVVEGIGDNGCEYMTGGIVCILGKTGVNFGAGMTGGFAYVLDESGDFRKRVNPELVEVLSVDDLAIHEEHLRGLITEHVQHTGSQRGEEILANWSTFATKFALVKPKSSDVKALLGHRSRSAAELRVQAQ